MRIQRINFLIDLAINQFWGFIEWIVIFFPDPIGSHLRYIYWKTRLKYLGNKVKFGIGVKIYQPKYVSIGNNCWIDNYSVFIAGPPNKVGRSFYTYENEFFKYSDGEIVIGKNSHIANYVVLQGHGGLLIGENTTIASGCKVYSMSHYYKNIEDDSDRKIYKFSSMAAPEDQYILLSPIVFEDNTALGLNSVVLPGATVHIGTWVAAQSTVTKSLPPFTICGGNPAEVIKERFS